MKEDHVLEGGSKEVNKLEPHKLTSIVWGTFLLTLKDHTVLPVRIYETLSAVALTIYTDKPSRSLAYLTIRSELDGELLQVICTSLHMKDHRLF